MKKRKIIILLSIITLTLSSIIVFASFIFQKIVDITSTTGVVEVSEMMFARE